jgi:hypothetical protein
MPPISQRVSSGNSYNSIFIGRAEMIRPADWVTTGWALKIDGEKLWFIDDVTHVTALLLKEQNDIYCYLPKSQFSVNT